MSEEEPIRVPPPAPPATDTEEDRLLDAAKQSEGIKGVFANHVFAQPGGGHVRLTFGEVINGKAVYHTSLVVPDEIALDFGRLIEEVAEASLIARHGVDDPDADGE